MLQPQIKNMAMDEQYPTASAAFILADPHLMHPSITQDQRAHALSKGSFGSSACAATQEVPHIYPIMFLLSCLANRSLLARPGK